MIVEVESNDNCPSGCFARFKEAGPARLVSQVRLYDRNPAGEWHWVTGWGDDQSHPACPAYAQLVEDSGSGLAYLVYGGLYGLRFKPIDADEPWIELRQLYVMNEWRGAGAARALMDWALEEGKARGVRDMYLTVYTDNHRARRFYDRYGFVEVGPYAFMVREQADEDVIMRKSL